MAWPPEMEIIDQLCAGDMPLRIIAGLFEDESHARRVLGIYIDRGILVLSRTSTQLPQWEAIQLLRSQEPLADDVMVSLTETGAKKFASGDWGRL